jgi:hypothetical protein
MQAKEAILVSGYLQYANYGGYANTFTFKGDIHPPKKCGPIIAIDAEDYRGKSHNHQKSKNSVEREILKAYAGFSAVPKLDSEYTSIATGNWGGGAFEVSLIYLFY